MGSAGAQLAGSIFALKTLFTGDTKEKLLSMIFLELQLIYMKLFEILASMPVFGFASGGIVSGPGTSTSDSIPAMLSDGEAVLNAKAVQKLGHNFINSVNGGHFNKIKTSIPHFANGSDIIDTSSQSTARGVDSFSKNVGTSLSTTNKMNIALVRDEDEAMGHFMRSGEGQKIMVDFMRKNSKIISKFMH